MNPNPITHEEAYAAIELQKVGWRLQEIARVLKRDRASLGMKVRKVRAERQEARELREIRA
jgi:transcriptional regulator